MKKMHLQVDYQACRDPAKAQADDERRYRIKLTECSDTNHWTPYPCCMVCEGEETDIEAYMQHYEIEKTED